MVRPGQVGVKQKLGKLSEDVKTEGSIWFNPFITKVLITDVQINDLELTLSLPSKEGLSVTSQISILYRIDANMLIDFLENIGPDHETIISNVFRSASADICAQCFAKDMHSGMRSEIEAAILARMNELLQKQGIVIEAVLMKSIKLPNGLSNSIEQKLQAEQDVMRMEFILEQEKLEAERKVIEANGTRDAKLILSEGLTEEIIRIRSIEAFRELANSVNAKIIITDGNSPMIVE
ncbi:MAG: prohibitin family protein [Flavobacteriales bacterium]|nr:prohibitin family protein [Flavobacteriales bacterium]